ncbi:hypothetical protein ACIQRK_10695 [Streptomyces anulatus]
MSIERAPAEPTKATSRAPERRWGITVAVLAVLAEGPIGGRQLTGFS